MSNSTKAKKKFDFVNIFLILIMVGGLAFGAYSLFWKDDYPEPAPLRPAAVAPDTLKDEPPKIDGADTEGAVAIPAATAENDKNGNGIPDAYESIEIPGYGNEADGVEGVLTHETDSRGREGDAISPDLAAACPQIANGSICIPSIGSMTYYHDVGTHYYNGVLNMSVPSTFSAGRLNTTAPIGADKGTSVFAAHVLYTVGIGGPFHSLGNANIGDDVIVRTQEGQNHTYRIYKKEAVGENELPQEMFSKDSEHRIVLVTCTGPNLDDRHLVWATPID